MSQTIKQPRIVVVEDQQVLATVYRNKFIAEGYQVEVASDGIAGLDLINKTRPDLVILDLMLPKLSGIEVLKKVRANALFKSLPVIIFSNAAQPGLVEEAWKAGATMVLSKSSHSPKQIVESVRTALKAVGEDQPNADSAEMDNSDKPSPGASMSQPNTTKGHVLLIEDQPDIRALLSFMLDQSGHQLTSVESHGGALHKARVQKFDICVLNRACPDGVGTTLCGQLRHIYPGLPIVMYSTAALPTEQQAGLNSGARAYLTKPGDLLNIGNLVSGMIRESKTRTVADQAPPVLVRLRA